MYKRKVYVNSKLFKILLGEKKGPRWMSKYI